MNPESSEANTSAKRQRRKPLRGARGSVRWWIAERRSRAVFTMLVKARSRKEALEEIKNGHGEGVDTSYYNVGPTKIIRQDAGSAASNVK